MSRELHIAETAHAFSEFAILEAFAHGAVHALHAGMIPLRADIEPLTKTIIGCAIEVHRNLGPGLLESVYQDCLLAELADAKLNAQSGRRVPLFYKGRRLKDRLKLDLLVEECVIVELKAVERMHPVYQAQVITYLKLTGYPAGLLMNFNTTSLRAGLHRVDHPELYRAKQIPTGKSADPD